MPVPQANFPEPLAAAALRLRQAARLKMLNQTGGKIVHAVRIGPVKKGALKGYHIALSAAKRRKILSAVVSSDGWLTTFRRLLALKTFFKHLPANRLIIDRDLDWLRRMHP